MKIGNSRWNPDFEVPLPLEIIDLVLAYIANETHSQQVQRTFWACSLVSRAWYYASVPLLYRTPILSGRNFEEFARTLCPPITARKNLTGLENYVKHLDMGHLAYETRRSITARLIRRTKQCLETFTAPAVSFSVNCLAPLSKCSNLTYLDMSSDAYEIPVAQLLSSLTSLEKLQYLSLPKRALVKETSKEDLIDVRTTARRTTTKIWPPNLQHLIMTSECPHGQEIWKFLALTFPSSLHSLSLLGLDTWSMFVTERPVFVQPSELPDLRITHITTLRITCDILGPDYNLPLDFVTTPFPNLTTLDVSGCNAWRVGQIITSVSNEKGAPLHLQCLILSYASSWTATEHIEMHDLVQLAIDCPKLLRIEVPETYLRVEPDNEAWSASNERDADELERMLEERFQKMKQEATDIGEVLVVKEPGVFFTEIDPAAFGLKRSLRV